MPGTQPQNVILVADELQDLPPASTLADGLAEAFAEPEPLLLLLVPLVPQAASSAPAAITATPVVSRAALRVTDRERRMGDAPQGNRVDPDFGNISGCTP
jgi:hypothetical protein